MKNIVFSMSKRCNYSKLKYKYFYTQNTVYFTCTVSVHITIPPGTLTADTSEHAMRTNCDKFFSNSCGYNNIYIYTYNLLYAHTLRVIPPTYYIAGRYITLPRQG